MNESDAHDAEQLKILNSISDDTGQADPRFLLWRAFCLQNNLDVNLLVSQLTDEQREKWNRTKGLLLQRERR